MRSLSGNQSFSQTERPSDKLATLPQADETWTPNGPVAPSALRGSAASVHLRLLGAQVCRWKFSSTPFYIWPAQKCVRCVLLQRSTACFGRRGGASGNNTATRPGINQAGRRSAVQAAMPPMTVAQLACPALSALLPPRSATHGLFIPVLSAQMFQCHAST